MYLFCVFVCPLGRLLGCLPSGTRVLHVAIVCCPLHKRSLPRASFDASPPGSRSLLRVSSKTSRRLRQKIPVAGFIRNLVPWLLIKNMNDGPQNIIVMSSSLVGPSLAYSTRGHSIRCISHLLPLLSLKPNHDPTLNSIVPHSSGKRHGNRRCRFPLQQARGRYPEDLGDFAKTLTASTARTTVATTSDKTPTAIVARTTVAIPT